MTVLLDRAKENFTFDEITKIWLSDQLNCMK